MKRYERKDMSKADILARLELLGVVVEIVGNTARIEVHTDGTLIELSTLYWYDLTEDVS